VATDDMIALKIEAAARALASVRSGMILGLGTGSTAREFVRLLGEKLAAGELEKISAVCTSIVTQQQAESLGIPILSPGAKPAIDLAVDGADEIDPELRLIKGLGGALLREKIVEQASRRFIVIADESKLVEKLGRGLLPVEVVRFACPWIEERLRAAGLEPALRLAEGAPLVTDEGNWILDIRVPASRDIADVVAEVTSHAGVVETGFFPREATEALIATETGVRHMVRGNER
jgi:ribose 5-phosphate isomerase A